MSIAFFLCFFLFFNSALPMIIPNPNCNQYFSYAPVSENNYIGIFTANRANIKDFYWEAKFSSMGANMNEIGILNPYPSEEAVLASIRYGNPVQMYVNFINIVDELPLLTHFALNGETLCTNAKYAHPETTVRVARKMSVLSGAQVKPPASGTN
ncbi:uncharacterized protein [Drosophila takahashii]|uniref:uncharacterized protein n=1 Tax=Drosophila takahashii TaxID=29030 RepID=UPI001CF8F443|nr:uncharacterized protein LOC108060247 [Drosophila takahashii]